MDVVSFSILTINPSHPNIADDNAAGYADLQHASLGESAARVTAAP
jgi:hypothetical protein